MVSLPNHDNEGSNPNSVALTMGLPRPATGLAKTEKKERRAYSAHPSISITLPKLSHGCSLIVSLVALSGGNKICLN